MGYIRHNAIICTAWDKETADKCRAIAADLGMQVSEILVTRVNGYASFLIGPDGSKEGWDDSNEGNEQRRKFFEAIADTYLDAVDIRYGGDGDEATIERDTNKP